MDAVLLRHVEELQALRIVEGAIHRLDMREMGVAGWACVRSVEPCPPLEVAGWIEARRKLPRRSGGSRYARPTLRTRVGPAIRGCGSASDGSLSATASRVSRTGNPGVLTDERLPIPTRCRQEFVEGLGPLGYRKGTALPNQRKASCVLFSFSELLCVNGSCFARIRLSSQCGLRPTSRTGSGSPSTRDDRITVERKGGR